jgi:hypothetical protein
VKRQFSVVVEGITHNKIGAAPKPPQKGLFGSFVDPNG